MSGIIGGEVGYRILKAIGKQDTGDASTAYQNVSKLEKLLGDDFWEKIRGKVVIDFGCGYGDDAIEMARNGASQVIGLDIREEVLRIARANAESCGVSERCKFVTRTDVKADFITSIDAFEHFDDPAHILRIMHSLLGQNGRVVAVFGPTWYHPLGGHLFSVFPFAHLIFTERALIRWRSDFKTDGATRFHEVSGGLNGMTISRFEQIVKESDFRFAKFEPVPIRALQRIAGKWTREFTTAVVRCELVPKVTS